MAGPLHDAVVEFLTADGWFPEVSETGALCAFRGDNGTWPLYVLVDEEASLVAAYSVVPVEPGGELSAVSELATRINAGLGVGCMEVDLEEAQVRFRVSVDVEGVADPAAIQALVRSVVYADVMATDRFLPAFRAVVSGEADPASAHRDAAATP